MSLGIPIQFPIQYLYDILGTVSFGLIAELKFMAEVSRVVTLFKNELIFVNSGGTLVVTQCQCSGYWKTVPKIIGVFAW